MKVRRSISVLYNNNTYDWLEGLIGEYGVGFMWRRKLQHFKDIFRFKTEKQEELVGKNARQDTIVRKKMEDSISVKPRFFGPLGEKQ